MASKEEMIRYMTEQAVAYWDTPKSERHQRKQPSESMAQRWFGLMPFALTNAFTRRQARSNGPNESTPPRA